MSDDGRVDLALAGLDENAALTELGSAKHPAPAVAFGLATEAQAPLIERILLAPQPLELALPAIAGARFFGWGGDPSVYLVSVPGCAARSVGAVRELDDANPGTLVIDVRQAAASVVLSNDDGEWLVRFEGAQSTQYRISRPGAPAAGTSAQAEFEGTVYGRPALPTPSIGELVGVFTVDPWLAGQEWLVDGIMPLLASSSPRDRAVGVGRLARLASPSPGTDAVKIILEDPSQSIASHCRRWLTSAMTVEAAAWIEAAALSEADSLLDAIDAWLDDPPDDRQEFLPFAHRRDDLESIAFVLAGGVHTELAATLKRLDERIDVHMSVLVGLDLDDDRLSTVAWVEPDAWWGLVGD